jgi:DNA-binding transcriptional ArsR family regulator
MLTQQQAFQILADPVRFQIIELLREGEKSVGELTNHMSIAQSGVSRHLKILQESGFVTHAVVAQKRIYSLLPEPFIDIDAWLSSYRVLWNQRLTRLERALTEKRKKGDLSREK